MTCHPIIFQAESVRAILDGRKTQTRRIVKPQPSGDMPGTYADRYAHGPTWGVWLSDGRMTEPRVWRCPYGEPGGLLWVREAWSWPGEETVLYRADEWARKAQEQALADLNSPQWSWRPSIFMPRWASRLTLRITDVRVQRVQEISEADARAEGCHAQEWCTDPASIDRTSARGDYASLWDSINGKRAPWDFNPWVWALTFEVVP